MFYREIQNGMKIMDSEGQTLGFSKTTAKIGIAQVVFSRVLMAIPSMGNYKDLII
jgi:hypothetical protein